MLISECHAVFTKLYYTQHGSVSVVLDVASNSKCYVTSWETEVGLRLSYILQASKHPGRLHGRMQVYHPNQVMLRHRKQHASVELVQRMVTYFPSNPD